MAKTKNSSPMVLTSLSTFRVETPSTYAPATAATSAFSARRLGSSKNSGKYAPSRSFGTASWDRPDAGVPVSLSVPVAAVDPVRRARPVLCPADCVDVGAHQQLREQLSDAHEGLKGAIAAALPGSSWQRCRTHFMVNLLAKVPKAAQQAVATLVRSIFAQPDAASTHAEFAQVLEHLEGRFPDAAELLANARDELLAFTAFPKSVWRQIWDPEPFCGASRILAARWAR